MYADTITESMRRAIDETNRRRAVQMAYNEAHGITPETVRKAIHEAIRAELPEKQEASEAKTPVRQDLFAMDSRELASYIKKLEAEMMEAARKLEFERAAELRDEIAEMREILLESTG